MIGIIRLLGQVQLIEAMPLVSLSWSSIVSDFYEIERSTHSNRYGGRANDELHRHRAFARDLLLSCAGLRRPRLFALLQYRHGHDPTREGLIRASAF